MNETINLRNKDGQTPLHLACLANKPECVKALIAAGADINLSGSEGDSVVHTAVATSSACAKEIFTAFPNQLHAKVIFSFDRFNFSFSKLIIFKMKL